MSPVLWTVLKTVSQSSYSLSTSYSSSEKMSSFLFQRCVRKKGKINRREGMRKELVGKAAGWDWGLETNGLLKFQKSFPPGLKSNPQMPEAQACGSTCKHLPSNAIQKCLIASSLCLLSGFPAAEQGWGCSLTSCALHWPLLFRLSTLSLCSIYCSSCDCLSKMRIIHPLLSFYTGLIPITNKSILNTVFVWPPGM